MREGGCWIPEEFCTTGIPLPKLTKYHVPDRDSLLPRTGITPMIALHNNYNQKEMLARFDLLLKGADIKIARSYRMKKIMFLTFLEMIPHPNPNLCMPIILTAKQDQWFSLGPNNSRNPSQHNCTPVKQESTSEKNEFITPDYYGSFKNVSTFF